jgi:PAS domain S-box-containing protein/putative nucleotidyltransferase with HDIG domain
MNKSVGIANQSQLGRLKLLGLIGFQLLTAAVIIAFAVWAFSHYRTQVRAEVEHDLLAIAEVKNQQITDFLKERISDAEVLAQRAGIWTLVDANASRVAQGLDMFTSIVDITTQLKNAYGYGDIVVFDENLQPIYPRHTGHIFDHLVTEALRKAKEKGQPQIADLHFHDENVIHFGIIYPVRASGALEGPVIGYIFLEMPAHPSLNRLVSTWPTTPSKSGEAVLLRRDNDKATYLTPLRHDQEMRPLRMQQSIDDDRMVAARALKGQVGVARGGIDYRGVPVLSAASTISGTSWTLLTKLDEDEAYAKVATLGKTIALLASLFIALAGLTIYYFWRNQHKEFEVRRAELERALDSSSEQIKSEKDSRIRIEASFARIFDASPLPKQIHSLRDLRITAINRAHERLFGYGLDEIRELDVWFEKIYLQPEIRETLRKGWIADIEKIRDDHSVSVSPELQMHCRDGIVRTMRASMSITGDDIIIVWTDLTELRKSEAALVESERRFRGMVEQTISGFYVVVDQRIAYVNPRLTEMVGWSHDEVVGHGPEEFVDQQSAHDMYKAQQRLLEGERTVSIRLMARCKDGSPKPLAAHSTLGSWDGKKAIVAILEDLTEKTRAEEKINSYVERLEGSMRATLQACSKMVELRDPYTAGHQNRVGLISSAIAREMGWAQERCEALELMGLVHDIGKIAVPAEFLTKPTKLSPYEFEIIKGHAQAGYEILKDLQFDNLPVAEIVRQHHERMNGSGYPQGLKGDQILPEAKILAVADVLESMASYRPYRPALGIDKALAELETNSGKLYDPEVVSALVRLVREKNYSIPK